MLCLRVYMCTAYVPGALGATEPLELELWVFVSYHVGAENHIQVPARTARALTL